MPFRIGFHCEHNTYISSLMSVGALGQRGEQRQFYCELVSSYFVSILFRLPFLFVQLVPIFVFYILLNHHVVAGRGVQNAPHRN